MRLLRVVAVLALLAVAGLAAYAYFGDMTPERREMRVPVSLTGGPVPDAPAPAGAAETGAGEQPAASPQDVPDEAEDSAAPADATAAGTDDLD